jgi:hypothetical protein
MKAAKQFVILRNIESGERFFSNNTMGWDPRMLHDGTIAYAIVGYADSVEEAQRRLSKGGK